jgi:hypothetical protein
LERNIREHLSRCIYCSQPRCNWTGNRRYALQKHLNDKHQGIPVPEKDAFLIYDAQVLVKQLLNGDITVEQAVREAHESFRSKAAQLGKLGVWRE